MNSFQLIEKSKSIDIVKLFKEKVEELRNQGPKSKSSKLNEIEVEESNTLHLNNNSKMKNPPKVNLFQNNAFLEIPKRILNKIEEEKANIRIKQHSNDNISSLMYTFYNYACCLFVSKNYKNNLKRLLLNLDINFIANV